MNNMELTSPKFKDRETIRSKYTCDGDNINPPLFIKNVPDGTRSLALIVEDPDAPAGLWIHWLVWNINPATTVIHEHEIPSGAVEGVGSGQLNGYQGPCPPNGVHRYFFRLYALNIELKLSTKTKREQLFEATAGHILTEAELMGRYARG